MARSPVHMKKTSLSPSKRASLRASDFAVPSERKYPINDLFHARLALVYVLSPSNAAYRDEVVRAVMARYPELQFWWAARSKGVEAKRARKATSRRMPGQRMVANPSDGDFPIDPFALLSELERLETRVKTMSDADLHKALAENKKKLKSATVRLRRVQKGADRRATTEASQIRGHYAGMCFILETELAERGLRPFPRHDNPRREVETEEYFAAMEPTRAKYAERSPEELLITRSVALKALNKRFAGKSSREVAKALGLDPNDASIIAALEDLRSGPYNINPHYEQQARRLAIARGRHVAPSGRLEQVDYRKKLRLPAHSPEELFGSLEAGIRAVKPHEDKSNRDIARALGLDAYDPLTLATLENLRDGLYTSNPSRKGAAKRGPARGGRTVAQNNAAKAMKLFHSGQASSLAEAWAMLRRR
jgi:hypothetical protein